MSKIVKGFAMRPVLLGLSVGLAFASAPAAAQMQDGPALQAAVSQEGQGRPDDGEKGERPDLVLTAISEMPQDRRDTAPREVATRKRFSLPWQTGVFQ